MKIVAFSQTHLFGWLASAKFGPPQPLNHLKRGEPSITLIAVANADALHRQTY
jgi:hypothetical protein